MLIFVLSGCASMTSVDDKGRVVVHHFGYTKIIKPPIFPDNNKINITGAKLLGFSIGEGFTIGYKSHEIIRVPLDCKVLIVVENSTQFQHLLDEVTSIKGDDICVTVSAK